MQSSLWDHWDNQNHQDRSSRPLRPLIETIETKTTHQKWAKRFVKMSPKSLVFSFQEFCLRLPCQQCHIPMDYSYGVQYFGKIAENRTFQPTNKNDGPWTSSDSPANNKSYTRKKKDAHSNNELETTMRTFHSCLARFLQLQYDLNVILLEWFYYYY